MPAVAKVHVDKLLDAIVIATKQELSEFIADQIFPEVSVDKESDKFGKYDVSTFLRRPTARAGGILRKPSSKFPRADFDTSTDDYQCEEYGLEHAMDDRVKDNADAAYMIESVPGELLTYHVAREREIRVKDTVTDTAKITQNTTLSGTSQWNDVGSNIVKHFEDASETILKATGRLPNLAVIPWQVWRFVKHHPKLLERIQYKDSQKPTVGPQGFFDIFAESFAPDSKILVPKSILDSSKEGQTASLGYLWPKDVLVAYVDPAPVKGKPTFGYTMTKQRTMGQRYRDEEITSDVSRVSEILVEKVVEKNCAYLIKSAVS